LTAGEALPLLPVMLGLEPRYSGEACCFFSQLIIQGVPN